MLLTARVVHRSVLLEEGGLSASKVTKPPAKMPAMATQPSHSMPQAHAAMRVTPPTATRPRDFGFICHSCGLLELINL